MNIIRKKYRDCKMCDLHETRTKIVFGVGNPVANIVLIGEAPGKNEDLRGVPFVGVANFMINEYLHQIGLTEEEVFITNLVKCRPLKGRNPYLKEINKCAIVLEEELQEIQPKIIVTMGLFPTKYFLGLRENISDLRGKIYKKDDYTIIPVYHPMALVRDSSKKQCMEEDFNFIKKVAKELRCF